MADEIALDLEELRQLQSVAKRPRIVSLINSEITVLEKVFSFYSFLQQLILFIICVYLFFLLLI